MDDQPPFSVEFWPGMPIGPRVQQLQNIVEDQLEFEADLSNYSNDTKELIAIAAKMSLLQRNPYADSWTVKDLLIGRIFISFNFGATFFYTIHPPKVYIMGAIFPWYSQSALGITAHAKILLKAR